MMELTKINEEKCYTSKFLVEQINAFRKEEGNQSDIRHSDLIAKIEKRFESKITERKISLSEYKDSTGRTLKQYELPFEYCLRILMDESEMVQDRCVEVMKAQQREIETLKKALPRNYKEALIALVVAEEEKEQLLLQVENLSTVLDDLLEWVSIIKVSRHNNVSEKEFSWRRLKNVSEGLGYDIKRAESPRFGYQNLYHINCFRKAYPKFNYELI